MFRYYRDSAVCYAYLSDLPVKKFFESRWFTRGWTLQEMIAPRELKFYDREWNIQGSKADRLMELESITGVDAFVLQGGDDSLKLVSIARKMSWASKRNTSRAEDTAYCLLGLLGISMPMLYGEGSRAFIRVQEELVKEYDDDSIFAWGYDSEDHGAQYLGFLAPSPALFAGCRDIYPRQSHLPERSEPTIVTSRGLRFKGVLYPIAIQDVQVLPLNCKYVDYDAVPGERVGIIVSQMHGSGSTYGRVDSRRPIRFMPDFRDRTPEMTIFASKSGAGFEAFGMRGQHSVWIRSMPTWPQVESYRLKMVCHSGLAIQATNNYFDPFLKWEFGYCVLVFNRESSRSQEPSSFLVAFQPHPTLEGQMRCGVVFSSGRSLELGDIEMEIKAAAFSWPISTAIGNRVSLKCYLRVEGSGFWADIHARQV